MGNKENTLSKIIMSELEEYKSITLDLSNRLREALDVIDMLVELHRETSDDLDRCCNIFEILLDVETEINTEEMKERFR